MPWCRARFKDELVWAQVDAQGQLVVEDGRVPMRYNDRPGAKVYSATAGRLALVEGQAPRELPPGVVADSPAAKPGSAKPGAPRPGGRGSGFGSAATRTVAQAAAARESAANQLAALPPGTHVAFTDGACKGNPGPAGAGAVVKLADGRTLEQGRYLGVATNNVGELTAVGMALELLAGAGVPPEAPVVVFTDSEYTFGVLKKGWKAKANTELIMKLRERLKPWTNLELRWVAGHAGIAENERADELAGGAIRQGR